MVVTLTGDDMARVQGLVEVECKPVIELAPILHQMAEEKTAKGWEDAFRPECATLKAVQVQSSPFLLLLPLSLSHNSTR